MNTRPLARTYLATSVLFALVTLLGNCGKSPTAPAPAALKDTHRSSEYLIITPKTFQEDLTAFESLKEVQGLSVTSATLEQIVAEFPDTLSLQESIRDFITYALEFWQEPKPRYVLLVGNSELIPTFRVESMFARSALPGVDEDSVSLDALYALKKGDTDPVPDVAVGRFPVANAAELQHIVDKTIGFESRSSFSDYATEALFLVDEELEIGNTFEIYAANLISDLLPSLANYSRVDIRSDSPNHGAKGDLFRMIGDGTRLFVYYGRGTSSAWSRTEFIDVADAAAFPHNQKPFVLTAFTSSQNYDDPANKSLIERLITMKDGGAVVSIAPSGLAFALPLFSFSRAFYEALLNQPNMAIGDVFLQTLQKLQAGISRPDDTLFRLSILGDPSLKFLSQ